METTWGNNKLNTVIMKTPGEHPAHPTHGTRRIKATTLHSGHRRQDRNEKKRKREAKKKTYKQVATCSAKIDIDSFHCIGFLRYLQEKN